ncbi:MAG: hypothetical protein D6731_12510 [Planctomycetota bacterium]|nr:MAG: hypothetical protein D6731_12510 [Planctomycetota bacterium]
MTGSSARLRPGVELAGYTVVDWVGQGEVGDLYLATTEAGTRVYLRVVAPEVVDDPRALADLERDLNALQEITHRNVAQVLGGGEEDFGFYYAIDAPATVTLFDLVTRGRSLSEREAVWLGRGLCAGLAALHAAGLCHGGVAPVGVVVGPYGPALLDLGWEGRLGGGERLDPAAGRAADLRSLHDTLRFAITPREGAPALSEEVQALFDALRAEPDSEEVADAWKEVGDRLGLPDPMAPDTLRKLLERLEGGEGSEEDSAEAGALAASTESPALPDAPRESSSGGATPDVASLPVDDDSDVGGPALAASAETVLPAAVREEAEGAVEAPSGEIITSEAALSAVRFAKNMLAEFPVEPASQELPAAAVPAAPGPAPDAGPGSARGAGPKAPRSRTTSSRKRRRRRRKELAASGGEAPAAASRKASPSPARSASGEAPPLGPFGDYELLEERVAGRTSTVFRARRKDSDRAYAVKVLLRGVVEGAERDRFLRAAEAARALQHPAIARVVDCGVQDGWVFVASVWEDGDRLSAVACEDSERAAAIPRALLEVLRAVAHAHERGVLHGDLRPENVLLDAAGNPKVLELGLPRLPDPGDDGPRPSFYAAPEVRAGAELDEVAEVYSLGAILFEVVTGGRLPDEVGGLARLWVGWPPAPSAFSPDPVPWQIDAIARKALQPDRAARYATVADMADDLTRCTLGPVRAPRPAPLLRLRIWGKKHPLGLAALALAVLGAGILLGRSGRALADRLIPSPEGGETAGTSGAPPGPPEPSPDGRLVREAASLRAERDRLQAEGEALRTQVEALRGRLRDAEQSGERSADERRAAARAAAERLVALGNRLLESDPASAREVFEEALRLAPGLRSADDGLVEAGLRAAEPPEPEPAVEAKPDPEALNKLSEGRAHLEAGAWRPAREALLAALQAGVVDAAPLLGRAERGLAREELEEARRRERAAAQKQARRRVDEARHYLERGAADEAWRAALEALRLDPEDATARAVLADAARRRAGTAEQDPAALARAARAEADAALLEARAGYKRGADPDEVYSDYFRCLRALDRAEALAGGNAAVVRERKLVARELAGVLSEHGLSAFADTVLRANGLEPGRASPRRPPEDPYLVVEEADRVAVQRAFNGPVRFAPSDADFADLRAWVEENAPNYRVRVRVESRIQPGSPPRVLARGLQVAVEDRVKKTRSPYRRIAFEGGPYPRLVRVTARGRVVLPLGRINVLPRDYLTEAKALARRLVLAAQGKGSAED